MYYDHTGPNFTRFVNRRDACRSFLRCSLHPYRPRSRYNAHGGGGTICRASIFCLVRILSISKFIQILILLYFKNFQKNNFNILILVFVIFYFIFFCIWPNTNKRYHFTLFPNRRLRLPPLVFTLSSILSCYLCNFTKIFFTYGCVYNLYYRVLFLRNN